MTGYEHQAVDHDASIRAERPGPDQVQVTITRGEDEPTSITMWAEDFEAMAGEVRTAPTLHASHIDESAGMDPAVPVGEVTAAECVFCQIIARTSPGRIVHNWPDAIALVPLTPVVEGHVLVIPKKHVANAATDVEVSAQTMARAAGHAAQYKSFNLITSAGRAATQSIDHLHVHVVPRASDDELMTPWGTIYGDDPSAPHSCRQVQDLTAALDVEEMAKVLGEHRIECTGIEGVTCRGCRERRWMGWFDFDKHHAALIRDAILGAGQ